MRERRFEQLSKPEMAINQYIWISLSVAVSGFPVEPATPIT